MFCSRGQTVNVVEGGMERYRFGYRMIIHKCLESGDVTCLVGALAVPGTMKPANRKR